MGRHVVVVMSNPVEGKEDEFHDWYENTHLDEVLTSCGWQSAQRFTLTAERGAKSGFSHLASYEAEGDSAEAVIDQLNATRAQRQQSDAIDMANAGLWIYTPAGKIHHHPNHT